MKYRQLSLGAAILSTLLSVGAITASPVLFVGADLSDANRELIFPFSILALGVGLPVVSWIARMRGRYRLAMATGSIPIVVFLLLIGLEPVRRIVVAAMQHR